MCGQRDESLLLDDMVEAARRLADLGPTIPLGAEPEREAAEMIQWNLVQLGEAARRLPGAIRERFGDVPWSEIVRTRDRLAHHYEGIDWHLVREIALDDAPALLPRLIEIRDRLRREYRDPTP